MAKLDQRLVPVSTPLKYYAESTLMNHITIVVAQRLELRARAWPR